MGEKNQSPAVFSGEQEIPDSLKEDVRRFVHQSGMPYERVGATAEEVIRVSMEELTDGADARVILFRTAARIIEEIPGGDETEGLFRFEEDNQLHKEIRKLPIGVRLPFVLMKLHDFNSAEAGSVSRMTADEALAETEAGYRILSDADPDGNLDRQLSLLRRAYGRIRYPEPEAEQPASSAKDQGTDRREGKRWWAAGAGLLAAVGLLISAAFILPAWAGPVDAAYIKKMESRFDEEEARFQEKIGATDMEMRYLYFIEEAKLEFNSKISELERAVKNGKAPKKKEADQEADELLRVFDLPSEMIADLQKRPLTDDKAGSQAFFQRFNNRKHELAMIFSTRFTEHQEYIKAAVHDGKLDTEEFFGNADDYPEPFRKAVQLMDQEGYGLSGEVWAIDDQVYPLSDNAPELGKHAEKLEPSVARVAMLGEKMEPAADILKLSPEEIAEVLDGLEKHIIDQKAGDPWHMPEEMAVNLFRETVFGGSTGRVFGEDGTVIPERRAIWKHFASKPGSHYGKLMGPVVHEMEQSGWKRSPAYNVLAPDQYHYALIGARDGEEHESAVEVFKSVYLPDEEYEVRAETLYSDLADTGDRSLLEGETQVMIALLSLFAAEREDREMMTLLSAENDPEALSLLPKEGILEGGLVEFQESAIEHHETGIRASVMVYSDQGNEHKIWLTYTPEGIWLIDRQDAP